MRVVADLVADIGKDGPLEALYLEISLRVVSSCEELLYAANLKTRCRTMHVW